MSLPKPVAANYSVPSGTLCIQVIVPGDDQHLAILQGLMATMTDWRSWQGIEEDCKTLAYEWQAAYTETDWGDCVVNGMQQIDLFALNATGVGVGVSYSASASLPFGYAIFTDNTGGAAMKIPVWLRAGTYTYDGWSTLSTNGGNTDVEIRDIFGTHVEWIAQAISQGGSFGTRVHTTATFDIDADDFYELFVINNGGAGAGRQANWISHHIRQTA